MFYRMQRHFPSLKLKKLIFIFKVDNKKYQSKVNSGRWVVFIIIFNIHLINPQLFTGYLEPLFACWVTDMINGD